MKAQNVAPLLALVGALGAAAAELPRGADPAVADKYAPSSGKFTCLDGSKTIPFSAVNDDYCDCADGSDEPGTSACEGRPAAWFYCENKGHIPGRILSSRVNDGICDPECCDGSDEWASNACPNRCKEVAKEYNQKADAEAKTRRTGAKLRSTYITHAEKEVKRLEEELTAKRTEVAEGERKVEMTRKAMEAAESQGREVLERRKDTDVFRTLTAQQDAVRRVRSQMSKVEEDLKTVLGILDELSNGYNPNGQDMAVKAAVYGYREVAGKVVEGEGEGEEVGPKAEETVDNRLNTVKDPKGELDGLNLDKIVNADLESLIAADDDGGDEDGLLYRIEEYIPDSLYDYYDSAREALVALLTSAGVLKRSASHEGPHVAAARERFNSAERDLSSLKREITNIETTLGKLTTDQWYGPKGEFRKLDGTCVSTIVGDYTYELCFFGQAKQKSNKDHSSNLLGSFTAWNPDAVTGTLEHYSKMQYRNGAKCWNGPMRSVNVELSCGTENALLSVSEPEKCEYKFKATTPALCWPAAIEGGHEGQEKDEL